MTSAWGDAWGVSWGGSWGSVASTTTAQDAGGIRWPPPWWLQQPKEAPLGTQPAVAYGVEIEIYAEFDPGYAAGKAKATARRITRKAEFDAGSGHGSAIAGDASAVVIPAIARGDHIVCTAAFAAGKASGAAWAQGTTIDLRADLVERLQARGGALARGVELECRQVIRVGRARGMAVAGGIEVERPSFFIVGRARGAFAFDFVELDNDLLLIAA